MYLWAALILAHAAKASMQAALREWFKPRQEAGNPRHCCEWGADKTDEHLTK